MIRTLHQHGRLLFLKERTTKPSTNNHPQQHHQLIQQQQQPSTMLSGYATIIITSICPIAHRIHKRWTLRFLMKFDVYPAARLSPSWHCLGRSAQLACACGDRQLVTGGKITQHENNWCHHHPMTPLQLQLQTRRQLGTSEAYLPLSKQDNIHDNDMGVHRQHSPYNIHVAMWQQTTENIIT